jgi:hypothetical protein
MGASEELDLVAKVVDVGDLRPVLDAGITTDRYRDPEARAILQFIFKYFKDRRTCGNVPTREMLEKRFPTVDLPPETRITLDATVEEFINFDVQARLQMLAAYIDDNLHEPGEVIDQVTRELREMARQRRTSRDVILAESLTGPKERYEQRKNKQELLGIPLPWDILNEETQGLQPEDYWVLYGRPKSMKTWLLLYIMMHAYDFASRRVLVYSREMAPELILDRCICILIGAPYEAFRKGTLNEYPHPMGGTMEDAFYNLLDSAVMDERTCILETGFKKGLIITTDRDDPQGGGVMGLRRKIEDHKPDVVGVDAIYLMKDDRTNSRSIKWDRQTNISQDLRDTSADYRLPLVATSQAKRESEEKRGRGVSNISYADAVGQDCTLAMEIIKKRIDHDNNEIACVITAAREINIAGFAIKGCAANNFEMMTRHARNSDGSLAKDEEGKFIEVPYVFEGLYDVDQMFKNQDEERKEEAIKRKQQSRSKVAELMHGAQKR